MEDLLCQEGTGVFQGLGLATPLQLTPAAALHAHPLLCSPPCLDAPLSTPHDTLMMLEVFETT